MREFLHSITLANGVIKGWQFDPITSADLPLATLTPPGGSDQQVQFNDTGVFGGSSSFLFDKTNGFIQVLSLVTNTPAGIFYGKGTATVLNAGLYNNATGFGYGAQASISGNFFASLSIADAGIVGGGAAGWFRANSLATSVTLADNTNAITVQSGSISVPGTSGNTLRWEANTTAPSTQTLLSLPLNVYGAGTITDLLGDPDAWVLVNIGGTNYKLPAYL